MYNIPRLTEESFCSACGKNAGKNIVNIAYYNCKWTMVGRLQSETKSFKMKNQTKFKQLLSYDLSGQTCEVDYAFLMVTAYALDQ